MTIREFAERTKELSNYNRIDLIDKKKERKGIYLSEKEAKEFEKKEKKTENITSFFETLHKKNCDFLPFGKEVLENAFAYCKKILKQI